MNFPIFNYYITINLTIITSLNYNLLKYESSRKLQTFIENRTIYSADYAELNVFETQQIAKKVDLQFSYPIIASMLSGKKIMHLKHRNPFDFFPGESVVLPSNEKMIIDFPLATTKEEKNILIEISKKGAKAKVVALAEKNAKESLNRKLYETNNNKNLFEGIYKKFNLKNNISLVEIYDNSHIQGTNSVGAMVTFGDEGFIKKRYRKFDIKTQGAEQDDFAMIKEVLTRRFKRAMLEKGNYLTLPDLILIDGGKGQYSTAKEVLNEFGLYDLPMIAIAKGKLRNSGNETFFYNGKTFKFEKNDPTLFFMQRLRDEAHRFAINSHRAKRQKGIRRSLLDQIDGIGSIRKKALLNHFGSARAVESASFDEIKSVEGVEEKVAKKVYNFFHE